MSDFSKATPRPWRLDREQYVRGKNGEWVGYKEADAALIVETVNSYEANNALIAELVDALLGTGDRSFATRAALAKAKEMKP